MEIMVRDSERTWAVCNICKVGYDIRKGGKCKCGNVKSQVDERGAIMTTADDSDELGYDNTGSLGKVRK